MEKQSIFGNMERPDNGQLSYRSSLLVQTDLVERALPEAERAECDAVRRLLGEGGGSPGWDVINEAELRLFSIMSDEMIRGEMPSQFQRAILLKLPEVADLQKVAEDPASGPGLRRQVMMTLLRRMYLAYTDRRVDRRERLTVDRRMMNFALVLIIVFAAGVLFAIVSSHLNFWPFGASARPCGDAEGSGTTCRSYADVRWLVVAYMGSIGAMFSRFAEYRAQRIDLRWEALNAGYSGPVIAGRLLLGAFAALFFYYLMAGNLLAGQLFLTDAAEGLQPDLGKQLPAEAFYRLMVWSVIAGFAERLVPDRFDELVKNAAARTP